jgi:hypothetical protein
MVNITVNPMCQRGPIRASTRSTRRATQRSTQRKAKADADKKAKEAADKAAKDREALEAPPSRLLAKSWNAIRFTKISA